MSRDNPIIKEERETLLRERVREIVNDYFFDRLRYRNLDSGSGPTSLGSSPTPLWKVTIEVTCVSSFFILSTGNLLKD